MKARYGLAALFVVVVAALIVVRDLGYLGGRTEGGPLALQATSSLPTTTPGRARAFGVRPSLEGDPVEIQSAHPRFVSSGANYRAARTQAGACAACDYPRSGKLFVGSSYDGEDEVVVGLEAEEPGAYYALDFRVDYKRGIRRYRTEFDQTICVAVGRQVPCDPTLDLPEDAPLAELGGPSDYGVRVREGVATLPADGRVDLMLSNLAGRTIDVTGLAGARPDAFRLRRSASRHVRLDVAELECAEPVTALRAIVDDETVDVPLSVALAC